MSNQGRRDFLKLLSASAFVGAIPALDLKASSSNDDSGENRYGMLVDTTVCIGCRNCEFACKTAHAIPTPALETYADRSVFEKKRRPQTDALTVINEYPDPKNPKVPTDVKVQCMHCERPACVSACIVGAFTKLEKGAVVWDGSKCIGCRYCMTACPFQIPAFEYEKAIEPNIRKCDFCFERTAVGKLPACAEICPVETMVYGKRQDLIQEAKNRIKRHPDRYLNHIFGEYEVGGTSWLYIASKDMRELGMPDTGDKPAPGTSEAIQHGIFSYFVPPVLFYSLLGMVMKITKRSQEKADAEAAIAIHEENKSEEEK